MKVLCFDIGGTDIKYGVIENEKFLLKGSTPTMVRLGLASVIDRLVQTTKMVLKKEKIDGVSVSSTGIIDPYKAKLLSTPADIPEFADLDFAQIFKENFNLPCVADNDVNCFALAEGKAGAAKHSPNFVMVTLGSGIGGAIVVNQQLWRGISYRGGEIGRMFINGVRYETIASVSALLREARKAGLVVDNAKEIFETYDDKNPLAQDVVKEYFQNVACGFANIIYTFNPAAIVIGGGISNRPQLASEIKRELKKIVLPDFLYATEIVNAKFANDGGMLGAYYHYLELNPIE